jgi:hypothetical protein
MCRDKTVKFMKTVNKPFIAFKVLTAELFIRELVSVMPLRTELILSAQACLIFRLLKT